jgi:DNA-binding HxlR family transcriptional regulator
VADRTAASKGVSSQGASTRDPGEPDPAPSDKRLELLAGYWSDPEAGEFDRLVYERVRLGIMSVLAVNPALSFSELKELLQTSDGNLSVHARKLENADYIACKKTFEGRVPRTEYRLTKRGREALERYLGHMESLIHAVRE